MKNVEIFYAILIAAILMSGSMTCAAFQVSNEIMMHGCK